MDSKSKASERERTIPAVLTAGELEEELPGLFIPLVPLPVAQAGVILLGLIKRLHLVRVRTEYLLEALIFQRPEHVTVQRTIISQTPLHNTQHTAHNTEGQVVSHQASDHG